MAWGILGDIIFEVHKTPNKGSFVRKHRFDYAKISTFQKSKVQYLRENLEEIEFEIRFYLYSGIDPAGELKKLLEEARKKEPLTLMVGDDVIGQFVIEEVEETYKITNNKGNLIDVGVKVKLLEYV
jgi:phage protein U